MLVINLYTGKENSPVTGGKKKKLGLRSSTQEAESSISGRKQTLTSFMASSIEAASQDSSPPTSAPMSLFPGRALMFSSLNNLCTGCFNRGSGDKKRWR